MAKSKDDIKYGTAQARLNEDEAVRVSYKHGTPLEGGKIADSEPVDFFPSSRTISKATPTPNQCDSTNQPQQDRGPGHAADSAGNTKDSTTINTSGNMSKKTPPTLQHG
ncbi:hypothetical protein F2P56_021226 [Juglans regia]|uniref:Uncharacterized protein LOC109013142 n=2 Tax=Juglans regia TaxID=51240 RepID=A0A2I4H3G8_JUGRE|nr:uncharacterized protein LOC109013142 [Juglans regia]KAF5457095.1 hypothetical protein F2P56_021226 [Juglans regia]